MTKEIIELPQESFYLSLLKAVPEALIVSDDSYRVILVNNAFKTIYGDHEEAIIGKVFQEIIKDTSKTSCPICRGESIKHLTTENHSHQAYITTASGKELLIRISHSILLPNNFYISVLSPMSDLVCLDQAQIDFVSTVSHELRTPMTSIKGFADTLLSAGDKLTKEQQTRFISIIKSQADRLTRLVENLLTVSRMETTKHKSIYRSLNLKYYIDRVVLSIKSKHPQHNFVVQIAENLPCVWADQDKLEQILTNLIDNAAKYSKEATTVTVKALVSPDNSDKILIKIIDQGIGIPPKYIPQIFNKFSRIDNPLTRHVQGTGLGLYITKGLVESMSGSISLTSNESGSIFTVELLVATPEVQAKHCLSEG